MSKITNDLNIFYYGGSGGFYLLHQLLITDKFECCFGLDLSYSEIRDKNFNIKNLETWKDTEIVPRNTFTLNKITDKNKIFIHCNDNDIDDWMRYPGKKLMIYTDINSHLRLAYYKKAKTFDSYMKPCTFTKIKDILTKRKQKNCFNKVSAMLKKTDIAIYYQDILTIDGLNNLFKELNLQISDANIQFMKQYLSLHPKKLLKKIGVEDV